MGRRGSKINITRCIVQHFSRRPRTIIRSPRVYSGLSVILRTFPENSRKLFEIPEFSGNIPQCSGNIPEISGNIPEYSGNLPESSRSFRNIFRIFWKIFQKNYNHCHGAKVHLGELKCLLVPLMG